MTEKECHCGKNGHAINSINCDIHGKTALQQFADWLQDVPKDTTIQITKSKKTIVFIRTDI